MGTIEGENIWLQSLVS